MSLLTTVRDRPAGWPHVAVAVVAAYLVGLALPGTGPWLDDVAPFAIVVVGVVYGTVTGLGAVAIVLTYRSNRFVNFAYGALGSCLGVLAIGLHKEHGWPYPVVLVLGVVGGAAVGAAAERFVLRRFRRTSRLVLTVASIGLAQLLAGVELVTSKAIGFVALAGAFEVPIGLEIDLGVKTLGGDEILIVVLAPLILAALAWFLLRTDVGTAVRGAAENEERALLLGIPVGRNTTIVWAVAGALAAFTFVAKAPFAGVSPGVAGTGAAVLLPALAAAVVARMESLPVALVAGIGLGVTEQLVRWNRPGTPSLHDAIVLGVIVVALAAQHGRSGRDLAARAASSWSAVGVLRPVPDAVARLPEVRWGRRVLLLAVAVLAVVVPAGWSASAQLDAAFAMVWAMLAVSLVVLTGWGGHISLGQFGLAGLGGMVAGNLVVDHDLDLLLVLIAAGVAGALVALVVGLPALRISGLFLAVTTLAFAMALDSYLLNVDNFPSLVPSNVPRQILFQRYDLEDQYTAYVAALALLAAWMYVVAGLRRARTGRVLVATRDNPRAAAAAGVPPTRSVLGGFALAGAIAGTAGAVQVLLLHSLSPGSFPVVDSITLFATAVIGGLGGLSGAVVGVLLFRFLQTLTWLGDLRLVLTGVGLLVVLYAVPGGIGQVLVVVRDRVLRVVARRRGIDLDVAAVAAGHGDAARGAPDTPAAPAEHHLDRHLDGPIGGHVDGDVVLATRGLDVGYGPVQVVFGVDLDVRRGELLALLGTNGAGKSTLLKGVCGLLPATGGQVHLHGETVPRPSPEAMAARGVSMMPGGRGVFPSLTVAENLRLAGWLRRDDAAALDRRTEELLDVFPVLRARRGQRAGTLSGGEQQMLALSMSLVTDPDVLLVDELSLGLAPAVVARLLEVVREVHASGTTVVIVEQSVALSLRLAERAVFLERGSVGFEGPTADLLERPDLVRAVFIRGGADASAPRSTEVVPAPGTTGPETRPVLACRGVRRAFGGIVAVDDVDLEVRSGEILGLIGHNGAGKTTLLDCLTGFLALDGGSVHLDGRDVTALPPERRAAAGLGRSFQEALLYPTLSVAETLAVARERHLWSRSILADGLRLPASTESELGVADDVEVLLERTGLGPLRHELTGELSTGTRRVVELACLLAHEPSVLLLDEPSSGVAQAETAALGDLLRRVRDDTGCAMVVIEHDMPLLSSLADRMVALESGAVIATGTPDAVLSHPAVIASYLGTDDETADDPAPAATPGRRRRRAPLVAR